MAIEDDIGKWVTERCKKRRKTKGPPPGNIDDWVNWLNTLSTSAVCSYEDCPAPSAVLSWINATIDDPDWPILTSPGP